MILHVLCGLPGSGKSTISNRINGYVISTDALRKCLWGDESVIQHDELVFDISETILSYMLRKKTPVIFDATNLTRPRRTKLTQLAKKFKSKVILHWIKCPFDIAVDRNLNRDRKVPVGVIKALYRSFQVPTLREGFDLIKVYNCNHHIQKVVSSRGVIGRFPNLKAQKKCTVG